jgi:hypothetical protein
MDFAPRNDRKAMPSRVRDAYLRARFPDVILDAADFHEAAAVIDAARRCLGAGQAERALQLLEVATDAYPDDESLWLAQLEVLSFAGERARFLAVVREFLDSHPQPSDFGEAVHFWSRLARA